MAWTGSNPVSIGDATKKDHYDAVFDNADFIYDFVNSCNLTDHGMLVGSGTSAITALSVASNGQIPIGSTGADPVIANITPTTNQVNVTNGAGTITLSTPQDIHSGATPTFAGMNSNGNIAMSDGSYIGQAAGVQVLFDDGNNYLEITGGTVGINTATPQSTLDVGGSIRGGYDTDTTSYFGRAAVGYDGVTSDQASFAHIDCNNNTNYATRQNSAGATQINSASGQHLFFRINNSTKMLLDSNGNLSIGDGSASAGYIAHLRWSGSGGNYLHFSNDTTGHTQSNGLLIGVTGSESVQIRNRENTNMELLTNDTTRMTIAAGGNVAIGNTTALGKLHVYSADTTGTVHADCDELVLENSGHCGMTILSGTTSESSIHFGDSGSSTIGRIEYSNNSDYMRFYAAGGEKLRVDAAGADVTGALTVTTTLDIGSSTTKRVAPTGTYVNNANDNPNISDTLFDVDSSLSEASWESVGPTGSGADNIWTAMDSVPDDADYVVVRVHAFGLDGSSTSNLDMSVKARETGGAEGSGTDNTIAETREYSDSSGQAYAGQINTHPIPVDGSIRFDLIYSSQYTTDVIYLVLVGWGFNP